MCVPLDLTAPIFILPAFSSLSGHHSCIKLGSLGEVRNDRSLELCFSDMGVIRFALPFTLAPPPTHHKTLSVAFFFFPTRHTSSTIHTNCRTQLAINQLRSRAVDLDQQRGPTRPRCCLFPIHFSKPESPSGFRPTLTVVTFSYLEYLSRVNTIEANTVFSDHYSIAKNDFVRESEVRRLSD
jgi:hypothetical protein